MKKLISLLLCTIVGMGVSTTTLASNEDSTISIQSSETAIQEVVDEFNSISDLGINVQLRSDLRRNITEQDIENLRNTLQAVEEDQKRVNAQINSINFKDIPAPSATQPRGIYDIIVRAEKNIQKKYNVVYFNFKASAEFIINQDVDYDPNAWIQSLSDLDFTGGYKTDFTVEKTGYNIEGDRRKATVSARGALHYISDIYVFDFDNYAFVDTWTLSQILS